MTTSKSESHVVDINPWEAGIGEELRSYKPEIEEEELKKKSIYRIPAFAKTTKNPTVLTPQVVSFGPYHHGEENLKLVEGYKQKELIRFLHKSRKPLRHFVSCMKESVKELQAHYEFLEDKWKDEDEFIKLMITDGCFMLELLRTANASSRSFPAHDPIFSDHGIRHKLPYMKRDMLMLENQLPLLVLKVLNHAEADEGKLQMTDKAINDLVFKFLGMKDMVDKTSNLGLHILDLYRKGMIQTATPSTHGKLSRSHRSPPDKSDAAVLTAVKLHESSVRFKRSPTNKITDISFDKGVLHLPQLIIDDSTESTFLNLMAFEHLHVGIDDEITSYVCFMDDLSDSANDVHLLRSKGIIHTAVGSDQAAAELLNSLTKEVTHDPTGIFGEIRKGLQVYSEQSINRWMASLKHIYFETPWTTLGLIAAVVLLVLTLVQTFYAVFA